jgi:hypothetical protein
MQLTMEEELENKMNSLKNNHFKDWKEYTICHIQETHHNGHYPK